MAFDDTDGPDEALVALAANARAWTAGTGETPIRLEPDLDRMLADPDAFRGELCRIRGQLQQQSPLDAPFDGIVEWVVRDAGGRPILLYVCGLSADHGYRDGAAIEMNARFYKRVKATSVDGRVRDYPAFVGALPVTVAGSGLDAGPVLLPVVVMMVVFLGLLIYTRRGRNVTRGVRAVTLDVDAGGQKLPDDPVDALTEMRRRAGDPEP